MVVFKTVSSCKFTQNNKQRNILLDSLASGEEKRHSKLGKCPRFTLLWQSPWENQVKGAKAHCFKHVWSWSSGFFVSGPVEMETVMMGSSVLGRRLTFWQPGNPRVHRGLQTTPYICFFKENCILYVSTITHPCSDWWCQSSEHFPSLPPHLRVLLCETKVSAWPAASHWNIKHNRRKAKPLLCANGLSLRKPKIISRKK